MKRNNKSANCKDWTTKYLKEYALGLHDAIYGDNACYGWKDIVRLNMMLDELDKRGVVASEKLTFN